jgi:N-acyl-D-amino-acid deacylase
MIRKLPSIAVLALLLIAAVSNGAERFDVVLKGGRVVDGTGAPWYVADVGIRDGRIVRIGRIAESNTGRSIDASGLIVAPGFIDMMGQTATPMLDNPRSALNLLTQGITTINAGEGASAAPLDPKSARSAGWETMAEYFQLLELKGMPVNVVQTVGCTQVRRIVLGEVDRRPTDEEMRRMKKLVREAMEAGAIGVSTALIYPPAVYATTEEIAELAAVAGEFGGRYYTHMRNEGDRLLEAIDEALEIGASAGTPVHIFHLKAAGRQNWAKMEQAIAKIKAARAAGRQVTADIYPYVNNGLGIAAFIRPSHFARGRAQLLRRLDDPKLRAKIRHEMENEGGWENWYRHVGNDWNKVIIGQINDKRYAGLSGKSLAVIAASRNEDPWETFFDLVKTGAFALPETMTDSNKIRLMQQEFISFCTDVGPSGGSRIASHPRAFGAFPRMLSHYVRDIGAISLERAVAQAAAVAANEVMAYDRGRIALGLAADLIVFDYEALADRATFSQPHRLSLGMKYVLVNGEVVLDGGKFTGKRPGRVLRGPGYRRDARAAAVSTGGEDQRMAGFNRMMRSFMEKHRVPGAALAVTERGRLVYARGYGYADVATQEKVAPTSLFRIASISKPITAVAILQLVEKKRLSLDDKVFDILKYEPHLEPGTKFDERQRRITIRHLLQHRGGWDRKLSFDAMFQSVRFAKLLDVRPPAGPDEVIRSMLGHQLDFDPGRRYAYSNYGYCLLGRVIETLTGKTYDEYVKQHVLAPLGVTRMRIGKTRLEDRQPGEVRYYAPDRDTSVFAEDLNERIPRPYGAWYLEAMDSHGAWIGSAVDLARFASTFDDPQNCKILERKSIEAMFARPPGLAGHDEQGRPKEVYYSFGWMNRVVGDGKINRWHTGSLGGTAALLVRRHDGRNWILLFNARVSPYASHLGRAVDALVHQAANEVERWPDVDLFSKYGLTE